MELDPLFNIICWRPRDERTRGASSNKEEILRFMNDMIDLGVSLIYWHQDSNGTDTVYRCAEDGQSLEPIQWTGGFSTLRTVLQSRRYEAWRPLADAVAIESSPRWVWIWNIEIDTFCYCPDITVRNEYPPFQSMRLRALMDAPHRIFVAPRGPRYHEDGYVG